MEPTPPHTLRFGVRAISGHRAATWKLWTPGDQKHDVYLACRSLGGELKASLHQSGNWHVSFSKEVFESGFADQSSHPSSRFPDSWPRPSEIGPGITLAYRIVVPWYSPTVAVKDEPEEVIWVAPAAEGNAIEFAVFLTTADCVVSNWPGQRSMSSEFVGSFPLVSGETVWVVHTTRPFQIPPPARGSVSFFDGADRKSLEIPGLRAVLFGDEPDGSRVMYDVPVQATYNDG